MNSCILMAEIIQEPQLRYTQDNQIPIAEMLVQFPASKADEPPATLKVVGWGNLAQEIQQNYHQGDQVVIEGRLSMNTIDRPEGFKEKRAELTAQRIINLNTRLNMGATATTMPASNVVPLAGRSNPAPATPRWDESSASVPTWQPSTPATPPPPPISNPPSSSPESPLDEIPF